MFELTYMHPFTGEITRETREDAVSYSSVGVLIEFGAVSALLIPWQRVTGLNGLRKSLNEFMRYTAFGV